MIQAAGTATMMAEVEICFIWPSLNKASVTKGGEQGGGWKMSSQRQWRRMKSGWIMWKCYRDGTDSICC